MRFRNRQEDSRMPEVNLVPMMDVLMTVLTFFIIISMTLTGQQVLNVSLPNLGGPGSGEKPKEPPQKLVFGLDRSKQLVLDSKPISVDQMAEEMVKFLDSNAEGIVILKADSKLKYEEVVKVLEVMRDIGGDRVSLAVDRKGS